MSAAAEPLLRVEGLTKHFAPPRRLLRPSFAPVVRAVDGVDLFVGHGETLALVGESGCGKTTVAYCLLRIVEPTAGRIILGGEDFLALKGRRLQQQRRRIQMVFQDSFGALDPRMDVTELVTEPLSAGRLFDPSDCRREALSLLRRVGLSEELLDRRRAQLSGGQRQRVAVARALALSPDLVVLDEPVSYLDASTRAEILAVLAGRQQTDRTSFIVITHELATVRQVAHRTAVMYLGRIVETGPTPDIFAEPLHPYTRLLLEAKQWLDSRATTRFRSSGDLPSAASLPSGCRFRTRCPIAVTECAHVDPMLENVRPDRAVACIRVPRNLHGGPPAPSWPDTAQPGNRSSSGG